MPSSDSPSAAGSAEPWPPGGPAGFDPADVWSWRPTRERQVRPADLFAGVLTTVAVTVLGLPAAALWALLAPSYAGYAQGGLVFPVDPESSAPIARDATFAVVTLVAGLLCGLVAFLVARGHGAATACGLAAGAVLASVVTWQLGRHVFGPADLAHLTPRPADGVPFHLPLTVGAQGMLLAWPIGAGFAFFLLSTVTHVAGRARTQRLESSPAVDSLDVGGPLPPADSARRPPRP